MSISECAMIIIIMPMEVQANVRSVLGDRHDLIKKTSNWVDSAARQSTVVTLPELEADFAIHTSIPSDVVAILGLIMREIQHPSQNKATILA